MNPKQMDVARVILDLAASAREGLEYVDSKHRVGDFESAAHVLTDIVAAFAEIEEALPVVGLAGNGPVQEAGATLRAGFRHYLERYEARDHSALLNIAQATLLPLYTAWQEALEQALRPYLAS